MRGREMMGGSEGGCVGMYIRIVYRLGEGVRMDVWCKGWGGGERVSDKNLLAATATVQGGGHRRVSYVPHKRW